MTDWREIQVADIDWSELHRRMGRTVHPLRRLCLPRVSGDLPTPYGSGSWSTLTLGAVADLGARQILRHIDVGPKVLATLQRIIDMAADGTLPLLGNPAPDALRPRSEQERTEA